MSFPTQMLQDLGTIYTGSTPKTNDESLFGGDIPFVTPGDLGEITPIHTATRSLTEEGAKTGTLLPAGAVLVCCIGSLGKIGFAGRPLVTNQQINAIVFDGKKIDPRYGFFACRLLKPQLESMAPATTVPIVNKSRFSELKIPVPPLEEQRRIAAILDQAETLRTQRRTALALLDSLTQSLFLDMFGDDDKGEPRFAVAALADVLEMPLQNGAYYPKEEYVSEGGVEMVHMSDAFNGIVGRGSLKRVNCSDADLSKYGLNESDILLARRSLTYEGAAKPCLVPPAAEPLIFESSFIRVTPDRKKLSVPYLFHYLDNPTIRDKRVRPFVTQSTISGINQSNLERVAVVVPPLPLQQTFATRIASIEALKATHRRALAALDALFASLQQRAFTGAL